MGSYMLAADRHLS